ncbi:YjcZ family sporulation protein [Lysinibacillus xylanilyticus]|uniref:YjcZ family sporulation protein n=1 Tax=Lysinibacillus xylanilyticus TaxID=582475 RepID=UPI002E1FBEE1|nr:YjcZ family sporulation protein [Lysinibacillus xylanilyticus]
MGYYGGNYGNCCYGGYGGGYGGGGYYGGGCGGGYYGYGHGGGHGSAFALIVVLFILLIIVGATFMV